MAVLDDFHPVPALTGCQAVGASVVEDEKVRLHEGPEQPWEVAVSMGQFEISSWWTTTVGALQGQHALCHNAKACPHTHLKCAIKAVRPANT